MVEDIAAGTLLVGADVELDDGVAVEGEMEDGCGVVKDPDGRAVEGSKDVGFCDIGETGATGNIVTGAFDAPLGAALTGAVEIRGSGDKEGIIGIGVLGAAVDGKTAGDFEVVGSRVAGARVTGVSVKNGVSVKTGDIGENGGRGVFGFNDEGGRDGGITGIED
jgi:hypothetical protein